MSGLAGWFEMIFMQSTKMDDLFRVFRRKIGRLTGIVFEIAEENPNGLDGTAISGVAGFPYKFPIAFAHGPIGLFSFSQLPVKRMPVVRTWSFRVGDDLHEAATIERRVRRLHSGEFHKGWQPIAAVAELVPLLIMR